jgi:16S rRNA (guanine(1405)-N(7))-methyltransferase
MANDAELAQLVAEVRRGPRYASITPDLIRRLGTQELAKGRPLKEAVKAVRNKLHQVGGAYQETPIPYARLLSELGALPSDPSDPALQSFCRRVMLLHASTHERLPLVERLFSETLATLAPVESVLDLACGLNPLALPWMPLAPGAAYYACDIYADMVAFVAEFLSHTRQPGAAEVCDLLQDPPLRPVQLAFALKTIPCLEQVDKQIGLRLLQQLDADYILVSYPAHSLGGRSKGMVKNYAAAFQEMVTGQSWSIQRFDFPGELAFLIHKK